MGLFKEVEGDAAVVIENGVFKQVPVYTRDGYLFAKVGGGFVRLMADGATSKPKTRLDFLSCDMPLLRDSLGRLCTEGVDGAKALDSRGKQLLLGAGDAVE